MPPSNRRSRQYLDVAGAAQLIFALFSPTYALMQTRYPIAADNPSLTLGLTFTYRPARLTVDLGTLLSQQLIEPVIHEGIERNPVLSIFWND